MFFLTRCFNTEWKAKNCVNLLCSLIHKFYFLVCTAKNDNFSLPRSRSLVAKLVMRAFGQGKLDKCTRTNTSVVLANKSQPWREINVSQHSVHTSNKMCHGKLVKENVLCIRGFSIRCVFSNEPVFIERNRTSKLPHFTKTTASKTCDILRPVPVVNELSGTEIRS